MVVVRSLATGAETTYPVAPQLAQAGRAPGIFRLSWAPDGRRLAVSLKGSGLDGRAALLVMDTTTARCSRR